MSVFSTFLLMAPPPQDGQQQGVGSMLPTLIMFGAIIVIFYFFMIRPQKKRQLEHQKMIDALKPGDKVITSSGMHGTIEQVNDKTMVLKVDTVKFTFEKSSIVNKVD
ncbi:MAG: preprotein translocase subunit YajC [Ignavibacteria bacterium]|nr:preprotein translocase subunit YajC [Ignavibacteria bacterium]